MKRLILFIIITLLMTGCASYNPSIPEGYTGPIAFIHDTNTSIDEGKTNIFYLSAIDGKDIENSRYKTDSASQGHGDHLHVILLNNRVPAGEHTFTIIGRTVYAMPLRAFAGTVYEVKGQVAFSPLPNEEYIVKGSLSEERSSVWIEKVSGGQIIKKIEIEGPSKLGFFEK